MQKVKDIFEAIVWYSLIAMITIALVIWFFRPSAKEKEESLRNLCQSNALGAYKWSEDGIAGCELGTVNIRSGRVSIYKTDEEIMLEEINGKLDDLKQILESRIPPTSSSNFL